MNFYKTLNTGRQVGHCSFKFSAATKIFPVANFKAPS